MKVLSVVGARPQFIKEGAVSPALRSRHEEVIVHTGQHYDAELSDVFFDALDIPDPDYNLGVGSGSHSVQTGTMIRDLGPVVDDEDPDAVLTYGDTNSTLACAVVASKTEATLAHVEAGLRSFDPGMPEEVNRVLTDRASDVLFAPSATAVENLAAEGITEGVHEVGDVMYDVLLDVRERVDERSTVRERLGLTAGEYVVATVHRAKNTDDPDRLTSILAGLGDVPREVVLPIHPRTEDALREAGRWAWATDRVSVVDPLDYVDFVSLVDGAATVATDSGGVQKEAFFLDTPCVILRDETEWTEIVSSGWGRLTGADRDGVRTAVTTPFDVDPGDKPRPYGDGTAAAQIADLLAPAVQ